MFYAVLMHSGRAGLISESGKGMFLNERHTWRLTQARFLMRYPDTATLAIFKYLIFVFNVIGNGSYTPCALNLFIGSVNLVFTEKYLSNLANHHLYCYN